MAIFKNLICFIHDKYLKLLEINYFSFEEIEYSTDCAYHDITAMIFNSLQVVFNLVATNKIAHFEYFRDDFFKEFNNSKNLDCQLSRWSQY